MTNSHPISVLFYGCYPMSAAIYSVLEKAQNIDVIGLAKRLEEVYKPNLSDPQNISKTSPSLYLLRTIRDEVHRYAIMFHRKIRNKDMTKSVFEDISGIGVKRINAIWKAFDSLEDIGKSSLEIIREKTGFSKKICKDIRTHANKMKN
mgnify:CR=1 FL=1